MNNRARYGWALLWAVLLVVLAAFLFSGGGNNSAKVQRLPDGSLMRLAAVSYGTNHTYRNMEVTGWRKKIGKFLSPSMLARLGWSKVSGGLVIGTPAGSTNLVIFTERTGIANGSLLETRTMVFDEQGNYFDAGDSQGTMTVSDGTNSSQVGGWGFPAFPRRGRRIGLRIIARQPGEDWQRVAEFRMPNPAPGKYPEWQAEKLPATKSDGDLTVTLESLESGRIKTNFTRAARGDDVSITRAVFRSLQAGATNSLWRPISVEIWDATGNHWTPYPRTVSIEHKGGTDSLSFDGNLWLGEAAWKMRFEFSRISDFEPDEIFTFNDITVPGTTQVIQLDNTTNIGGIEMRLKAICGTEARLPGNMRWSTMEGGYVNVSIQAKPWAKDRRLTLVKIVDDAGREVKVEPQDDWSGDWNIGVWAYAFEAPEGARRVNFTFALSKSRFVEFTVKPVFMKEKERR